MGHYSDEAIRIANEAKVVKASCFPSYIETDYGCQSCKYGVVCQIYSGRD